MTRTKNRDDEIISRLNIVVSLLIEQSQSDARLTLASKIEKLVDLGVSPTDIAKILGKPLGDITSVISKQKEKKGQAIMNDINVEQLLGKLDAIIRLLVIDMTQGKDQTEQIRLLSQAGFQPKNIAEMLGTTGNNVRVRLSSLRKQGKVNSI